MRHSTSSVSIELHISKLLTAGTADPNEGVEDAFEVVADLSEKYNPSQASLTIVFEPRNGLVMSAFIQPQTDCNISLVNKLIQLPTSTLGSIFLDTSLEMDVSTSPIKMSTSCHTHSVLPVVEYQTVVLRGDMDAADEMLATIPADQMPKIARFLEGQGIQFIGCN